MNWQKAINEFKKAHDANQDLQTNFKKTQIPGQHKTIRPHHTKNGILCLKCGKIHKNFSKGRKSALILLICDCQNKLIWNYELTNSAKLIFHA